MAKAELTIIALSMLAMLFTAVNGQAAGGITAIDAKTSKEAEELGRFAVEEYNKKGNQLQFEQVVQAAQQDTNYFLRIEASDKGEKKTFNTVVQVQSGKKEMLSFT
ncbi:hypothetical protein F3Y22_tig00116971pilonHSYRG00458 [Hibiscus syriacus]|uniref:Cystatin domain-containing protein n=1 Tax=Hibiscus syriacus TaxID=106335 RepID=A0A6A2XIY2_HIBSY|nr:cysteine proteinase inhibitor A-like [Hibiscus syriacus]KAE8658429.1 hypothetical protein F3Y22_tig00116971pilonHSYRG00458 [Hibiscus syriacus]